MDVIGQRCEDLLMVLEEERMMVVDAVEDQHVQGIGYVFSAHKGVEAENDLLSFSLVDV